MESGSESQPRALGCSLSRDIDAICRLVIPQARGVILSNMQAPPEAAGPSPWVVAAAATFSYHLCAGNKNNQPGSCISNKKISVLGSDLETRT
jgi:hypothetical protein